MDAVAAPYEKNGVQVAPTISLNSWFKQRGQTMLAGQVFDDPISFGLSGNANGKPSYWGYDYKDFAPRFAIAYSPGTEHGLLGHLFGGPGKTSIRAGAGMYYDHFGEGIVNTFDQDGSFGLSTLLTNTKLQFRWDTFNLFNSVRFDALTANTGVDQTSSFGNFTKTLTLYRRMEFGARFSF